MANSPPKRSDVRDMFFVMIDFFLSELMRRGIRHINNTF